MRNPKIHNRICRSTFTLHVCLLLTVGLWWLPQRVCSYNCAASLALTLLTAFLIVETNNVNQIIRVRSRIVSSIWLLGMATFEFFHDFQPVVLVTFCLAVCYYFLFRAYQQIEPVGTIFHLYATLSLSSLIMPHMLWLAPFFMWYLIVFMRTFSLRGFSAGLLGLALPYWFWLGWQLWQEDLSPIYGWYAELMHINMGGIAALQSPNPPMLAFYLLAFLALWTSVYYLMNSYDDKIRTRMMLYVYVCQSVVFVLYGAVVDAPTVLPLLLLSVAPLIGHYFALRNTWLSLIVFFLTILAIMAVALFSLVDNAYTTLIG